MLIIDLNLLPLFRASDKAGCSLWNLNNLVGKVPPCPAFFCPSEGLPGAMGQVIFSTVLSSGDLFSTTVLNLLRPVFPTLWGTPPCRGRKDAWGGGGA